MADLTSRSLIVAKGIAFLALTAGTSLLLFLERPSWRVAFLLVVLVWSACRFYYFLFYVLQHYVDPRLRYAGLLALLGQIRRSRAGGPDA
ncbi:MAG TPA: hypothetical protein VFQ07_09490 [Candidatus Polarisedimenticolia bacterium]|nr:hypothetical protein [Candidatus Polarisedimenticolia bacterium]